MSHKPKMIPGIPDHKKGSFHDTESRRLFDNQQVTHEAFNMLKDRFLSINGWKDYCGEKSADFKLYDAVGNPISRSPQITDLIRIDIPGPGNPEAKGYDWVEIVKISDQFLGIGEIESLMMVCVPAKIPGQDKNSHIAHFYAKGSSSIFKIARGSKYIKIGVYGRNETPNMQANLPGKIRNLMIAVGGMLGISKMQWKAFTDKIIDA